MTEFKEEQVVSFSTERTYFDEKISQFLGPTKGVKLYVNLNVNEGFLSWRKMERRNFWNFTIDHD